jgi:hypothetical protein
MTKKEINKVIESYWKELYNIEETPNIDRCLYRQKESNKIYNYLITDKLMEIEEIIKEV